MVPPMPVSPEFLSIPETATYKFVRDSELPTIKVGGQWRIHSGTLLKWAEHGGEVPSVPKAAGSRE